jgi:hypothetical protein
MNTQGTYTKRVLQILTITLVTTLSIFSSHTNAQETEGWKQLHHIGGTGSDFSYAITTDQQGRLIATSNAYSDIQFEDATYTNGGNGDGVIVRYKRDGSFDWYNAIQGSGDEIIYDVATDRDGNVYVTGKFNGVTQFGDQQPITSNGGSDLYVAKLDANGQWAWIKTIGGAENDFARGVTVDSQGRVSISGQVSGDLTIDGETVATSNNQDVIIAQWSTEGVLNWYEILGGDSETYPYAIESDPDGNLYAVGQFNNTATFQDEEMTSTGYYDIYIIKMTANGSVEWTQQSKGYYSEQAYDLAVNDEGQVFITGFFSDKADFGYTQLQSRGADDSFIAKLDTDGTYLWAQSGGGTGWDYGRSVTINRRGNAVVTGDYKGLAHFGSEQLTATGGDFDTDIFMVEYSPNGEVITAQTVGDTNSNFGYSIISDQAGSLYLSGIFFNEITLGEETATGLGENDVFIGKYGAGNLDLYSNTDVSIQDDTVAVSLTVEDAYNLYYYELTAQFDTEYLEYVGAEADSLFQGNALFIAGLNNDQEVGISAGRTDKGLYGDGNAFTLYFKIKRYEEVKTMISFPNVQVYDQQMNPIKTNELSDQAVNIDEPFLVWPGDADNDGEVSELDVLALSTHWTKQGTTRSDQTINWEPKRATVWDDSAATFADTDGNGTVNNGDLRAITYNFGKTQSENRPLSSDDDPTLMAADLNAAEGDTLTLVIKATDYFQVKGLSTRLTIENVPARSYEILDLKPGPWIDMWKSNNESLEFIRIQNGEAVIATAGQKQNSSIMINKNETLFTIRLRATESWQEKATVAVKNFSAVTSSGEVEAADGQAELTTDETKQDPHGEIPETTQLLGNYPNPFNPSTNISYNLNKNAFVSLKIYNMLGQEVATLVNQPKKAGTHQVSFNAEELASGMYMYRLVADNVVETRKMTLVK